jgi:thiosulfate/3-mercaptopyruvate sulfurtransferase
LNRSFEEICALSTTLANGKDSGNDIIDVRPEAWFQGALGPGEKPGGSIPGSKNIFFKHILNEDSSFKTPEEIRTVIADRGGDVTGTRTSVVTCASGVTACIYMAALAHAGN